MIDVGLEDLGLFLGDAAVLLDVGLRPEHQAVVDEVERLLADDQRGLDDRVAEALGILKTVTVPGGVIDPDDHQGDVPWCRLVTSIKDDHLLRSRTARRWFTHLEKLTWSDHHVSPVMLAVAAYAVAKAERELGHAHERWWWAQLGAAQVEGEQPVTLGLVAVARARLLLGL